MSCWSLVVWIYPIRLILSAIPRGPRVPSPPRPPLRTDCSNLFQAFPPASTAQPGRLKSQRKSPCLHPVCLCTIITAISHDRPPAGRNICCPHVKSHCRQQVFYYNLQIVLLFHYK
ncbi:hypothetical protein XENOCAPTIV_015467 [Xenoophorus captivus]|uniref:Secreted protein n=1 Tax=Xenoophorus captivus TaxID=1517983 RepID=A0ABV0SCH0_9TELE